MKHLKKYNESSSKSTEMKLEDYFVEFIDNGFTIDIKLNAVTLKYIGKYDFEEVLEMYNDVIIKLLTFKGITKTNFTYKESMTDIIIEVKNKITEGDVIEITFRGDKLKLKPHAYSIYGNPNPQQSYYTPPNATRTEPLGEPRPAYVNCIILYCKDEDNKNHNITWEDKFGGALSKEDIKVKVHNVNVNIDLENATKVIEIIEKNEITPRGGAEAMLDTFSNTITAELLVK
jgi:hypothetical protein